VEWCRHRYFDAAGAAAWGGGSGVRGLGRRLAAASPVTRIRGWMAARAAGNTLLMECGLDPSLDMSAMA
jgi:hypothetical protein